MQGNIAGIVAQFKQSWSRELEDEAIRAACREAGHSWRERELGPVTTVKMFLLQVLFGNVACNFVPHLAGKDVTGSAYCEARARLPLAALEALLTRATMKMAECVRETGLWLGHRLLVVDGSSFSMPDTPELRSHFGQSGQQAAGCGFPTAHWLALVHFGSGLFQRVIAGPLRTHDLSGAARLHPELAAGDVLLGDRAFCSFAHLALLLGQGVEAVLRPPTRDCRLPAGPPLRGSTGRQERTQERPAPLAVDRASGRTRSAGRVVSAGGCSGLDVGGKFRRVAGDPACPRAAIHGRPPWLSRPAGYPRHHLAQRASLHPAAAGRSLWPEVDDRSLPAGLHLKRTLVSTRRLRLRCLHRHYCG